MASVLSGKAREPDPETGILENIPLADRENAATPPIAVDDTGTKAEDTGPAGDTPELDRFRPGYDEGLLVILERIAGAFIRDETDNAAWARAVIDCIRHRGDTLPKLPEHGSRYLLGNIVLHLNKRSPATPYDSTPDLMTRKALVETEDKRIERDPRLMLHELKQSSLLKSQETGFRFQRTILWTVAETICTVWDWPRGLAYSWKLGRKFHPELDMGLGYGDWSLTPRFLQLAALKVTVCDYGGQRFQIFDTTLGSIVRCFEDKPAWATVRWIHAPVGMGTMQSAIEGLFSDVGYHQNDKTHQLLEEYDLDAPALCSAYEVLDQYYSWFRHSKESSVNRYHTFLNREAFDPVFRKRLAVSASVTKLAPQYASEKASDGGPGKSKGRKQGRFTHMPHRNRGKSSPYRKIGYWDNMLTLIPRPLGGSAYLDLPALKIPNFPVIAPQSSSDDVLYWYNALSQDHFRIISRPDGYVLTMSTTTHPGKERYPDPTEIPRFHPHTYTCGELHNIAEGISLQKDYDVGSDWLTVYLITSLTAASVLAPTTRKLELQKEYEMLVQHTRSQRDSPQKAVNLVRTFVTLIEEISQVQRIDDQNQYLLDKLMRTYKTAKRTSPSDSVKYMIERIQDAKVVIEDRSTLYTRDIADLRSSLDVVFQLATVEQNERSLKADLNNRAILIFTIVTIIFLPLSFFTSYFGMNLKGIVETDRTERYFWAVCGSSTAVIVGLTVLFGFKERVEPLSHGLKERMRARMYTGED